MRHDPTPPIAFVLITESMTFRPTRRPRSTLLGPPRPDLTGLSPTCVAGHVVPLFSSFFVFFSCSVWLFRPISKPSPSPRPAPSPLDPAPKLSGVVLKTRRRMVPLSRRIVKLAYQMGSDISFGTSNLVCGTSNLSFGITYKRLVLSRKIKNFDRRICERHL